MEEQKDEITLHTCNVHSESDDTVTWCGKLASELEHVAFGGVEPPEHSWFMRGPDLYACRACRNAWERAHRKLSVAAYDTAFKKIADATWEAVSPILGESFDVWANVACQVAENALEEVCKHNNITVEDGDLGCVKPPARFIDAASS